MHKATSSTHLMTMMMNTFLLVFFLTFSDATDVMTLNQSITGNETLVSSGGFFELGFFSPGASKNKYIGLWYKNIRAFTVVWVANRDNPVTNSSSATLKLVNPGILLLTDDKNTVIWSTEASKPARNPVAKLLDNGNFVIKESNDDSPENYLWQGFDYPTDTLLPDMKFGWNLVTNHEAFISSWKSIDDPGTGLYNYHFDPTGYPQGILRSNNTITYRTGPWNGQGYSGLPGLSRNAFYTYDVVMTDKQEYYYYQIHDRSVITRYTIDVNGVGHRIMWVDRTQDWVMYATAPIDNCDAYKLCGAYGMCNPGISPLCGCLDKFIPTHPDDWEAADWSNGCVRRTPLNCATDGFLMYKDMKLPDARNSWYNTTMSLEECRIKCLMNCSCEAYSTLDIRNGGSGCLLWFGQLVDIKQLYGAGQDIYIRMAASELKSGNKKGKVLMATLISVAGFLLLCLILFIFLHRRKKTNRKVKEDSKALVSGQHSESHDHKDMELPTFDLLTISKATDDFSFNKKLGEGGFGPVYKGTLEGGQEIAVKRLSTTSMQGLDEFKNEVIFIAKLQHRNLVKLLGCCIEGTEKMLIYEYMPNLSLDLVLFDPIKSKLLDWPKRFQIIIGIARGLLYLHQDSRLRIIHRDLKASNILLDEEMKPKISDFGMARSFGGNETEANTSRVVGTYGYMSPEYAIDGLFSIKSDVFSFGVIVLEILSGKKNRGFFHTDHHHNLLGHAWILFREGRSMELVSKDIIDETSEMEKSIHVGLLCVQKNQEDRPNMSSVIFMLENDVVLPQPRQPGFFAERDFRLEDCTHSPQTTNEMSITMPEPR